MSFLPLAATTSARTSFVRIIVAVPEHATTLTGAAAAEIRRNLTAAATVYSVPGTSTRLATAEIKHPGSAYARFAISY